MNMIPPGADKPLIVYPDCDGQPMSENTLQFMWIVILQGNLDALFRLDPNVFVAGDLLWYPVEGAPKIRNAPDAMVVFGRPKGHRGSYQQWLEDNIAPQVVFEVLSPGNTPSELARKLLFYERYGVEEAYVYDPQRGELTGWLRKESHLHDVAEMNGFVSPRLGIRFDLSQEELQIFAPNGQRFLSFVELVAMREQAERETELARQDTEQARQGTEQAERQAEQARQQAEQAGRETEQARQQAEEARQRAERLAAQLRALGVEPEG